jgi:RNA polymerase sigma factor (sigma-70 family)
LSNNYEGRERKDLDKQDRDRLLSAAMDEYGHYLIRLAYAFLKDKSKAEDIVQEVFIRYYLHLEKFEGRSSVKTYLYRITVNECHNYFRSWSYRMMELTNFTNYLLVNKQTPEQELMKQESTKHMAEMINQLPLKYKEIVWLYYYAELSIQEIADVVNCPVNTVKTRLARGRKLARISLSEEDIEHA